MENKMNSEKKIVSFLERIAIALENITNKNRVKKISISDESCYLWSTERMDLLPIKNITPIVRVSEIAEIILPVSLKSNKVLSKM